MGCVGRCAIAIRQTFVLGCSAVITNDPRVVPAGTQGRTTIATRAAVRVRATVTLKTAVRSFPSEPASTSLRARAIRRRKTGVVAADDHAAVGDATAVAARRTVSILGALGLRRWFDGLGRGTFLAANHRRRNMDRRLSNLLRVITSGEAPKSYGEEQATKGLGFRGHAGTLARRYAVATCKSTKTQSTGPRFTGRVYFAWDERVSHAVHGSFRASFNSGGAMNRGALAKIDWMVLEMRRSTR